VLRIPHRGRELLAPFARSGEQREQD